MSKLSSKFSQRKPYSLTIQEIRDRAKEHIKRGAVTETYHGDLDQAVRVLNEALATELVCVLRYRSHYYNADGILSQSVAGEFLEHSIEEWHHADRIAARIKQLDGKPDFNPATLLERSHAEFQEGATLVEMIEADLVAERIAIDSYRDVIRYFGENDPTSRRMMESILASEEEHAEELSSLLMVIDPRRQSDQAA